MCGILANEEFDDHIRLSAGLTLKNSLASQQQFGWLYTDQRSKTEIKSKVRTLLIMYHPFISTKKLNRPN